jgi:hypothetical protein
VAGSCEHGDEPSGVLEHSLLDIRNENPQFARKICTALINNAIEFNGVNDVNKPVHFNKICVFL